MTSAVKKLWSPETARQMRDAGATYTQIAEFFGTSDTTARRRIRIAETGVDFREAMTAKHMKRLNVDVDRDTLAQLGALAEVWGESRAEVFRIILDWGLETASQDAHCRRAIEKAAIDG